MDNSFVVKLMERATKAYGYPRNSCRKCNIGPRELRTERKAILAGPLHVLATAFMARLPFDLPHELDHEKLRNLYLRDGIGLVKCNGHTYWVRRKQFSRWIRKNAHRICVTTAEKIRRETAWDREYTQSYYRMVEADERWLDEELEEFLMNEEPPLEEVDYI